MGANFCFKKLNFLFVFRFLFGKTKKRDSRGKCFWAEGGPVGVASFKRGFFSSKRYGEGVFFFSGILGGNFFTRLKPDFWEKGPKLPLYSLLSFFPPGGRFQNLGGNGRHPNLVFFFIYQKKNQR